MCISIFASILCPSRLRTFGGSINHYTQISILWAALHLTDSDRRILVSVSQNPEDTIKWYAEAFGLNGWDTLPQFVPPPQGADAELFGDARMVCVDYCGAESHEVTLLDRGIATNHGQMPQKLRAYDGSAHRALDLPYHGGHCYP